MRRSRPLRLSVKAPPVQVAHLGAYVLNAPPDDNLVLDRSPQRETVPLLEGPSRVPARP